MGTYAVLMGDLVGSETSTSVDRLHKDFNAAIRRQNQNRPAYIASPLTITLGDEFQGLIVSLTFALSVLRDLRLDLLAQGIDCRFAMGTVELKTKLNPRRAWNMMGRGLSLTREALNERQTNTAYRFVFSEHPDDAILLDALGAGLTLIERSWTKQQLHDIRASLSGNSPAEIASKRNVSVHSVYKVRSSGNLDIYLMQWEAIAKGLQRLDKIYGMER